MSHNVSRADVTPHVMHHASCRANKRPKPANILFNGNSDKCEPNGQNLLVKLVPTDCSERAHKNHYTTSRIFRCSARPFRFK